MFQIDNGTAASVQPTSTSSGVPGFFTDGNPAVGVPATILPAEFMNTLMLEMLNVLAAAGVTPAKAVFTQLATSIKALAQQGASLYAADTGSANVYTAAYTPAVAALADGMVLNFKAKTANTGPSTFSPNGLTAKAVVGLGQAVLQGGEIVANGMCNVIYSATLDKWVLKSCSGGGLQVAPATQSQHAVQMGQLFGGLKGISRFTASGSFTVPAGVTQVWASGCAAGGGGGSSLATNSTSFVTGGSGGGAGQPAIRTPIAVTPGQVIPVTIGTGGTGATAATNNATAGGATQFGTSGSLLNLAGGSPGQIGAGGTATTNYGGPPGGAGFPNGGAAMDTVVYTGGVATGGIGGIGGSTPFGNAGFPGRGASGSSLPAFPGTGFGAGGSGSGGAYNSSVTAPGGVGAAGLPGLLIFEW